MVAGETPRGSSALLPSSASPRAQLNRAPCSPADFKNCSCNTGMGFHNMLSACPRASYFFRGVAALGHPKMSEQEIAPTSISRCLLIYVVWHPKLKHGQELAESIYAHFSRDFGPDERAGNWYSHFLPVGRQTVGKRRRRSSSTPRSTRRSLCWSIRRWLLPTGGINMSRGYGTR